MSEQRFALVHQVLGGRPLSQVAREFGVSRKTAYKWLKRHHADPQATLRDQSRRPLNSPRRSAAEVEQRVVQLRETHRWGPRKIHRLLRDDPTLKPPSIRTVGAILRRRGCVCQQPPQAVDTPLQSFERPAPNELWQLDHKGPIEVNRQRITPLTVIDDHSRYCLRFHPLGDVSHGSAWAVLWDLFGEVGLPLAILCDNAFAGKTVGLSGFDASLVRLGIEPLHGRPYHPQTQGKVERLHRSVQEELIDFNARRDDLDHFRQDCERWRRTYNSVRPHEALGDQPPVTRWRPSDRKRPPALPPVSYEPGVITRRVSFAGDFRYRNARIVVGRGLVGQTCRIEERQQDIAVYYAWKCLRIIPADLLGGARSDKII